MRILVSLTLVMSVMGSVSFAAAPSAGGTRTKYTSTPAQKETNMVYMPTVGMTFNQITGDGPTTSFSTGFNAGIVADIGEGDTVFHTGLLYSQLNTTFDSLVSPTESITITFIQNCLAAPIQAKTYFPGGGGYQPYVMYGGLVNVLLGAKMKALGQSADVKDSFNTLNILASVGAGFIIPMNGDELTVDASFSRSISRINSEGDGSGYNSAFMINAGMAL